MTIGDKIKKLRTECGMNQIQLAKKAGLTPAAISQYESNNRVPQTDAIKKIAEALNTSVDFLVENQELDKGDAQIKESLFRTYSKLSEEDKRHLEEYMKYLSSKS